MIKCPKCMGFGSYPYPIDYEEGMFDETICDRCNGEGEVPTREDWFCSLPTEEKAKVLAGFCVKAADDCDKGKTGRLYAPYWRRWLKEEYRGKEKG